MTYRYTIDPVWDLDSVVKDLGYIRQWIEGFAAAGQPVPHGEDALRKAQTILRSATKLVPPEALSSAVSAADGAADDVDEAAQALNTAMARLRQVALGFAASVDTHRNGEDASSAAEFMGSAVPKADAQ